ncbi:MAG: hypothetical protein ACXVUE_21320 [Solirubrobacteraceae bacterium]
MPVAFTPGLVPHFDVSLDALLELPELLDEVELPPLLAPGALLVLLLLLPHPARIAATPTTAANATHRRARGTYSNNLTISPPRVIQD